MIEDHVRRPRGRIVVAKVGLDGHSRGAKVLSRLLSDAGFEVIFLGVRTTAPQVARVALQEWVDVVAISLLSGAHVEAGRAVRQELDALGLAHVPIVMGGLIPAHDAEELKAAGVARCFHPGPEALDSSAIVAAIEELVAAARRNSATPAPAAR